MRLIKILPALAAMAVAGLATVDTAHATSIVTDGFDIVATQGQLTTTVPGATTFANSATFAGYTGSVTTYGGTFTGGVLNPQGGANPGSAIPGANITNYVAASANNSETLTTGSLNYLGFLWGSADEGNTVTFYNGNSVVASFTGAELLTDGLLSAYPAAGSFVDFTDTTGSFNKVVFSTTGSNLFETSNFAAVPEPATWAFMLVGFAMVGAGMRRRSVAATLATA